MSINDFSINQTSINSELFETLSGNLISFNQNLIIYEIGQLVAFNQDVELLITYTSNIIQFEQSIVNYESGNLISFNQNVQLLNTFLARTGYDVDVYIDGYLIPKNKLCDMITIKRSEGVATDCRFTLKTASGTQNIDSYMGQTLVVNITNSSGVHRVFTGWVNNPTFDLIQQKILFTGTDRRQTQINALSYGSIKAIGSFSTDVFGDPKDQADELEKRLMTTASSFDFDVFGHPQLTAWVPKTVADFTLAGNKMYYDNPRVAYSNRTKTTNTVNVTVSYKHQRLHQQICGVTWAGYGDFLNEWFNQGQPSFPQRSAITSAASATSWTPLSHINFVSLWPAGGFGNVQWQPNQVTNTYGPLQVFTPLLYNGGGPPSFIWPDGKQYASALTVLDAAGKPLQTVIGTTITDTSSSLCRGAAWAAGKKFAQNVSELYSLRFTSPQAINKYGVVDVHENVTITDPYNTSAWDNDKAIYNTNATPPTAVGCATNSAGYALGSTAVTLLAAGTGYLYTGNLFTIDGDTSGQYYTCYQDINVASGGTLTFSPGLGAALLAQEYTITPLTGATTGTANFFIDQKPKYNTLKLALDVVCKKAQTTLQAAHRDVQVNFKRSLWPEVDLMHTVATTATQIAAKGKVYSITHTIDVSTTEAYSDIELRLSKAFAQDGQSIYSITVPPYENISYIGTPSQLQLQTHYGIDPNISVTPGAISWNGFIGNRNTGVSLQNRTQFPEAFIVNYPPLSTALTNDRTITQNPPGVNSGVTTNNAGYLAGVTTITLAAGGTGQLLQGDTITITGDSSLQTYIVQTDILDVSSGGILNMSPGLGANLSATTHTILSAAPSNIFTVNIPDDPLVVSFPI